MHLTLVVTFTVRVNPDVRPGRTIVIGTDAGLFCRVYPLAEPRLVFSAVTEDGTALGPHQLDFNDPQHLLKCDPGRIVSSSPCCSADLFLQHSHCRWGDTKIGGHQIQQHVCSA